MQGRIPRWRLPWELSFVRYPGAVSNELGRSMWVDATNAIAYSHYNMLHTAEKFKRSILGLLGFCCVLSVA